MAAKEQNSKTLIGKTLFVLLFTLLGFSSAYGQSQCGEAFNKIYARTEIRNDFIKSNAFTVNRTLDVYAQHFQFRKTESLHNIVGHLANGSVWVDMGAGRAHALIDGLNANPQIAEGVAIAYKKPPGAERGFDVPGRFRYLDGDFVENMSRDGKLNTLKNRVDLITDVFGPLSYSEHLPPLLQIYLDLLRPNGIAVFNIMEQRNFAKADDNEIYFLSEPLFLNRFSANGHQTSDGIASWLRTIPGIEVVEVGESKASGGQYWEKSYGIKIRKVSNEVVVPQTLKTINYEPGSPPKRAFEVVPEVH